MPKIKKLYRDHDRRKVSGLCAGFAEFTDIDVSIVRIVMLALIIFSGIIPGIAFYLIAAAVVPTRPEKEKSNAKA